MDTNRLRQFCAIAELGSLTKASQLLHLTHSALSKSMKHLQEEFGFALFRPAGRGIELTDDGLLIYKHAKEFLDHEARLFKIKDHTQQSSLKIGMSLIFQLCIGEFLKRHLFTAESVAILDLDPGYIEKLIVTRQIDFGVTFIPFPHKDIEMIEIGKFRSGCYHLNGSFQGKKFSDIPFVTPSRDLIDNPLEIRERDGWLGSVFPRYKKFTVTHLSIAIDLALQGLCAVYMPDFVALKINATRKPREKLIEYPLPKKQKHLQRAFLIKHKNQVEDAAFKQLYQIIKGIITQR